MVKTREEVEELKKEWLDDPCWDLYDTEGFEEYRDELKKFQEEWEAKWEAERMKKEKQLDIEADELGVRGLYRLVLRLETILKRHEKAIEALADGNNLRAYKILRGFED